MRSRLVLLLCLCALASSACGSLLEPAAAVVNDRKITVHQLDVQLDRFEQSAEFKRLSADNDANLLRRQFEQGYLAQLIRRQVLRTEAEREDVEIGDEEVDDRLKQLQDRAGGEGKLEEQTGLTTDLIRELVRDGLVQDELRASVVEGVVPTDQQLRAEYDKRLNQYRQTRASHILFKAKDRVIAQGVADELQATPKAELSRVFKQLSSRYSTDKAAKAKGGDLGYFGSGQFVPEFEEAAGGLREGAVSDPVKTQFGFHIIYVTDRRTLPFDDAKGQFADELTASVQDEVWSAWLFDAFSAADIKLNPRYGEFDLETQQISNVGAGEVPGTEAPTETEQQPQPPASG